MATSDVSVVLVHGAWADGSGWGEVIVELQRAGVNVVAAPLPLTTFSDDVQALERSIARTKGPVVVVGHAYGGAVVAETKNERVEALVYIAALAPDEGETVAENFYRFEPHQLAPKLEPDENGLIWLPENAFSLAFAQNASRWDLAVLAAAQRPISPACITVPVGKPRWKSVPTWYLLSEADRMITAQTQQFMAERMKARTRTANVDHSPMVSAPAKVLEVVLDAVRAVRAV